MGHPPGGMGAEAKVILSNRKGATYRSAIKPEEMQRRG